MERFIGIDLGTTYSSVATIDEYGRPIVLKDSHGEALTPSVIYWDENGQVIVGSEAKEMLQAGSDNVAMFFKRFVGDSSYRFYAYDREYTAKDLSAILLRHLKGKAEEILGGSVRDAVITVPAYFNDIQRNEVVAAGKDAGLNVLRIINEPTAAAITYGIKKIGNQRFLVYDLGGGTFDVTVLQITADTIQVLATGGDHQLGGKDWDDQLINYVAEQFKLEFGVDPRESVETYNDLAYDCERLKKQLTSKDSAVLNLRYNGFRGHYTITRQLFEDLTQSLMFNTQSMTELVLKEAKLGWRDLDGALLVGGSTRMPMVENWVRKMSGKEPIRGVNVDEAVSLGAAIQASTEVQRRSYSFGGNSQRRVPQFTLGSSMKIVDVMSHSLGAVAISQDGEKYINSIIIPKNKAIPITERKDFLHHTRPGNDNTLDVYLTQGETAELRECLVVGKYVFHDIAHVSNGNTIINIEYSYDENGMIVVNGTQKETGRKLRVEKVALDDLGWLYEKPKQKQISLDIILAIDVSGSMEGKPLRSAASAAREFIGKMDLDRNAISVIGFENEVHEYCSLTHSSLKLKLALAGLRSLGGTYSPLQFAFAKLRNSKNKPVIVVLTDGEWFDQSDAIATSDKCRQVGIDIIAIGFGEADEAFLRRISTISMMTDLDNLTKSFGSIAQELNQKGNTSGMMLNR